MIRYKSAKYTVEHPLLIGATAGRRRASPTCACLSAYGLDLGEAFQLRDDMLGVFGDPSETGKPAGDDLREGKRTVLVAQALDVAGAADAALFDKLLGPARPRRRGVGELRAVLLSTGALDRVEEMILDLTRSARTALHATTGLDRRGRRHAGRPDRLLDGEVGVSPRPADHVVVVGAGLAGLSAAMHLAGAGRKVTLLERDERARRSRRPGGAAGDRRRDYHLDTGPTVLTMPDLFADCFAAIGQELGDWVELLPLDPAYSARFADGSSLDLTSDPDAMAARIREFAGPEDADGYRRYVEFVSRLYKLQMREFIDRNFSSPLDLAGPSLAKLVAMRGFSRLAPTVGRYFRDERLQKVFSFQAMYAGVSPQQALAIYAVISYMDLVEGVFYPVGGMNALPTAMAAAAGAAGVDICYDTEVSEVRWQGKRVREVIAADGRSWTPDSLVLTLDMPAARELLGRPSRRPVPTRYSPSCVVLSAGPGHHLPRRPAPHHGLRPGLVRGLRGPRAGPAHARPVLPRVAALADRPEPGARGAQRGVRAVPHPQPRVGAGRLGPDARPLPGAHAEHHRGRRLDGLRRRDRRRGADHPAGLGRPGPGGGHAVRGGAHVQPDRAVPLGQHPGRQRRLRRVRHGPGGRGADGPGQRAAGRRARDGQGPGLPLPSLAMSAPAAPLDAAYEQCRLIHAEHGRTYYLATRLLPRARRPHVWALYAFARVADELVDDLEAPDPDALVTWSRTAMTVLESPQPPETGRDPVLAATWHTVRHLGLEPVLFEEFLTSMQMDITVDRYATWEDLRGYMRGSAAVIGEMMAPLLGAAGPDAMRRAGRAR